MSHSEEKGTPPEWQFCQIEPDAWLSQGGTYGSFFVVISEANVGWFGAKRLNVVGRRIENG